MMELVSTAVRSRKFFPTGREIKGNSDSNAQKGLSEGCQKPAGFQKLKEAIK